MSDLPAIPVIDARSGGPLATAHAAERQMRELLRCARRIATPPLLALADRASRRWLERAANPYLAEIDGIAAAVGRRGAYALNTSYEWCCTCGVGDDRDGGVHLLRVLDWRQAGLGRNLVVAWQRGPAGDFANITWPGFVGVVTAMAPGRFAAAIKQPPMMSWGLTRPVDWAIGRARVWQSRALPPVHLLRRAFETCANYDAAKRLLSEAPLCLPALFTLAGPRSGEGCVIERAQSTSALREMPAAVANHWVDLPERGHQRGGYSRQRQAQMEGTLAGVTPWLARPIVNRHTRLVAVMNPAHGRLSLQGWEKDGPATADLTLQSA